MGSFEKTLLRFTPWIIERIPDHLIPDYGQVLGGKHKKRTETRQPPDDRDLRHSGAGRARSHSDDEDYDDARLRRSRHHDVRRAHSARRSSRLYDRGEDNPHHRLRRGNMAQPNEDDGYEGHRGVNSDGPYDDPRATRETPYPDIQQQRPESANRAPFGPATGIATGAATGAAVAGAFPHRDGINSPPPTASNGPKAGASAGYVPYADIYGPSNERSQAHTTRPDLNPVGGPYVGDRTYQQNSSAQDVSYGGQPGYKPDADSNHDPRRFDDRYDDRYDARPDNRHDDRYDSRRDDRPDDRYDARRNERYGDRYDERDNEQYDDRYDSRSRGPRRHDARSDYDSAYSPQRSPRRGQYLRDESPSSDSYYDDNGRRQSPTAAKAQDRMSSKQRGKSGVRAAFDTSEKSLGYSALGALAGGMLGSELGGPLPIALGAAAGALGTSAFRAREKKKEESRRTSAHLRDDSYDHQREPRRSRDESRETYDY